MQICYNIFNLRRKSPLTPTSPFSYCSISVRALTAKLTGNLLFQLPHLQLFHQPIPTQSGLLLNSGVNAECSLRLFSSICYNWSPYLLEHLLPLVHAHCCSSTAMFAVFPSCSGLLTVAGPQCLVLRPLLSLPSHISISGPSSDLSPLITDSYSQLARYCCSAV